MSKKHYCAIAAIIKSQFKDAEVLTSRQSRQAELREISFRLADYFQSENPRFNRQKFLSASGLNNGAVEVVR